MGTAYSRVERRENISLSEFKSSKRIQQRHLGFGYHYMQECEKFQAALPNPTELPDFFTDVQITSEILGISNYETFSCCQACHKKIPAAELAVVTVKCNNCKLLQRKNKCPTKSLAQALVEVDEQTKTTITLLVRPFSKFSVCSPCPSHRVKSR